MSQFEIKARPVKLADRQWRNRDAIKLAYVSGNVGPSSVHVRYLRGCIHKYVPSADPSCSKAMTIVAIVTYSQLSTSKVKRTKV